MAKRFQFNLQAVLRYREVLEDQRRREFLEAKRKVEEEKLRREALGREHAEIQDEITQSLTEGSPFQSIVASYHLVGRLENAMSESIRRQRQLEMDMEQRRQAMIVARQETRMMETLKERRKEEFLREQDRLEQAILDELSIQAQGRTLRERRGEAGGDA